MKLYVLTATYGSVVRSQTYTLAEVARLEGIPDSWIDTLADLPVHHVWTDSDGDKWERVA